MNFRTPLTWLNNGAQQMTAGADIIPPVFGGVIVYRGNVSNASGTSVIPYDNTPPLITEGTQLWTATITPTLIGGNLRIDFSTIIDLSKIDKMAVVSIFRNNTLLAVAASSSSAYSGNRPSNITLLVNDPITSLVPVTYSCRIGTDGTGTTWYVGQGATATMGTVNKSGWCITETA